MSHSPFHDGEQAVQTRVGVREAIEPWARRVVRTYMPEQHREFFSQLPFVVAGARDGTGRPWVTMLVGPPGFVTSPDERELWFGTKIIEGDALESSLSVGSELGLLAIELDTRRRNRVNGTITENNSNGMRFEVGQAFGNCPQYITERQWFEVDVEPERTVASRHDHLDTQMQGWIESADTMFIASGYRGEGDREDNETYGMDASHRGGAPGFVEVIDDRHLAFPDYAGNNHFNTIGNLVMDPSVGLLFVDFERGSLLQISGTASIDWESEEVAKRPGAQRLVNIEVEAVVRLDGVLPLRWSDPKGSVRTLRIIRKLRESADVMSFDFVSRDGGDLPDFEAGQHLPIELHVDGLTHPVKRTYSLSNGPGQGHYRISVKRESQGLVSRLLHDAVNEGDFISSRQPAGDFVLESEVRPVMLISAGIGVTPMLSMLHQLTDEPSDRPITFLHGARDGAHHALAREVRQLAATNPNVSVHVSYSRPRPEDLEGRDFDRAGRVDGELVQHYVQTANTDFYICGPVGFMADVSSALTAFGVAPERIHTETFGPAAGGSSTGQQPTLA
jgi:uncharacterized protein